MRYKNFRPDALVIDDPDEYSHIESPTTMERRYRWLERSALKVGGVLSDLDVIIIYTTIADNDFTTHNISSVLGGLVGVNDAMGTVRSSYAMYTFTADQEGATMYGGLIGNNLGAVEYSYWSTESFSIGIGSQGGTVTDVSGHTNVDLQTPNTPGTATEELYWNWETANWNFGDTTTYPALKFNMDLDDNGTVSASEDPDSLDGELLCLIQSDPENNQDCNN